MTVLDAAKVQHKVRLAGIDAPERHQPFGTVAKKYLSALAFGKAATIEFKKRDKYGRIVGKVIVSGEDICLEMVRQGLAWFYRHYQGDMSPEDRASYAAAELRARTDKTGLWEDSSPVPPWEFRHHSP